MELQDLINPKKSYELIDSQTNIEMDNIKAVIILISEIDYMQNHKSFNANVITTLGIFKGLSNEKT